MTLVCPDQLVTPGLRVLVGRLVPRVSRGREVTPGHPGCKGLLDPQAHREPREGQALKAPLDPQGLWGPPDRLVLLVPRVRGVRRVRSDHQGALVLQDPRDSRDHEVLLVDQGTAGTRAPPVSQVLRVTEVSPDQQDSREPRDRLAPLV